ncbi:MAG: hypothetical protein U0531_21760 [Dehalococcoidia bacterium]
MRSNTHRWLAGIAAAVLALGAAGTAVACTGDCSGDGEVTVNEVILGVNIALGSASVGGCGAMDANGDGQVSIDEIISAINGALGGCAAVTPEESTPTPTATAIPATPTPCGAADGTADLTATSASPTSGQGRLRASCVTVENAGGTRTELTRVTARGTVNGVDFELLVYFVTATGAIDTVTYGWSPSPEFPDFYTNLAFCNGPGCSGASMDLASKTITLNGTALSGDGASATLDGTITLERIPDPEPTPTPQGCPGGRADLTFSDVQGAAVPATLALGAAQNFSRPADPPTFAYLSAQYDGCPMPFPSQSLSFQFSGKPIAAGTTYQVGSIDGNLNQIEYREQGFNSAKVWEARNGSLVVDAVDNGRVTYRIVAAQMRPKDLGTTGTFTLNVGGVLEPAR